MPVRSLELADPLTVKCYIVFVNHKFDVDNMERMQLAHF